jgi:hypothetical protein
LIAVKFAGCRAVTDIFRVAGRPSVHVCLLSCPSVARLAELNAERGAYKRL